jgi:regulator of nucleoside diphosphate kinase
MAIATELPDIVISADDHKRLQNLADAAQKSAPRVAEYLQEELDRATVCGAAENCAPGVRMGSFVEFRDDDSGRVRTVQLVFPADADVEADRISILTPVGAALIGLSEGQSIEWRTRAGEWKTLTVLKVSDRKNALGYLDV